MPSPQPSSRAQPPSPEALAFSSLAAYAVYQWREYRLAPHHLRIIAALEAVERGDITRLMICMPPRHGKSMLASEYFPAWFLGRNPSKYIIHATYAQELAEDFGRKIRNQITDPVYQRIFPGVAARQDSASAKRFNTTAGGVYYALGVGGPATGRGAHLLLIDDPIKGREDADSEVLRRRLKDWYKSVAYTRLMPDSAIVLINTRWHFDDLSGWQLKEFAHEGWHVLSLPAIDTQGNPLWPSDYPLERLEQIKRTIGTRDWSALYQQTPVPDEGGILKLGWFRRFTAPPVHPEAYMIVQSWDTAFKPKEINDPSVCLTWIVSTRGWYLIDVFRKQVDYPTLRRTAASLAYKYKPDALLIEDKASGQSLIQDLKNGVEITVDGAVVKVVPPVIAIEPEGDKVSRANAVAALIEGGTVYLPEAAEWLVDFETEIGTFPLGATKDQVDALTQFLAWARHHAARYQEATSSGQRRIGLDAGDSMGYRSQGERGWGSIGGGSNSAGFV